MDCNVLGSSAVRFDGFQSWSGELPALVCSHIYIAEDIYGAYIYTHIYIAGLKLNIQRMKIMASDPIDSWQINRWRENGNSDTFYFLELQNHSGW